MSALFTVLSGVTPFITTTCINIGVGLSRVLTPVTNAGGPRGPTVVVLMTDGLNNEPAPPPNAQASLDASVQAPLSQRIPVHVICTGADLVMQSP